MARTSCMHDMCWPVVIIQIIMCSCIVFSGWGSEQQGDGLFLESFVFEKTQFLNGSYIMVHIITRRLEPCFILTHRLFCTKHVWLFFQV